MSNRNAKARASVKTTGEIFRWPLIMALANAVGLIAALVGDGWFDVISWVTLALTLVVIGASWRGWRAN